MRNGLILKQVVGSGCLDRLNRERLGIEQSFAFPRFVLPISKERAALRHARAG